MTIVETDKKLEMVLATLEDRKAEAVQTIDLQGRTLIADYFVLASGTSNVHIRAIVDGAMEKLKKEGQRAASVEGYTDAKWVLVDFGDIVLHVFAAEEREFYNLESLWKATEEHRAAEPAESTESTEPAE